MSPRYLRNRPDRRDDVTAALLSGALALGVGVFAFYVSRLFLAREAIARPEESGVGSGEQRPRGRRSHDAVRSEP